MIKENGGFRIGKTGIDSAVTKTIIKKSAKLKAVQMILYSLKYVLKLFLSVAFGDAVDFS